MKAVLFDLDGVIYQGDRQIEGSSEVISWIQEQNIPHLFVTNTSSRPRSQIISKLKRFNINTTEDRLFTPAIAASEWLRQHHPGEKVVLFVTEETKKDFNEFPAGNEIDEDICAVVIGDLGEAWSYARLNSAFRILMHSNKPELLALGMTRYWQADDGLRLDVAPFVSALSYASNTQAKIMGKPAAEFFHAALNSLGYPASQCLMLGDDIRSDIDAAQQTGIKGILVKTGKYRPTDMNLGITPDAVLDSIRDFPQYWDEIRD